MKRRQAMKDDALSKENRNVAQKKRDISAQGE
jgi:hypothetical protein